MTDQIISSVVAIAMAIVGIAILAVLVSRQSNTVGVIGAAAKGFAQDISAATAPINGGGFTGGGGYNIPTSFQY